MPNWALIRKTLGDYLALWVALLCLAIAFAVLFMAATNSPMMEHGLEMLRLPFIRRLMTVMIGSDPLETISPTAITAITFMHPLVWTLIVCFALALASGVIAGEIDRGTMDLLGALPISRTSIYTSVSVVLAVMGAGLCWAVWVGAAIGRFIIGAEEVRMDLLVRVAWHLCATFGLIASFSLAISGFCNRRGTAVAAGFFLVFYAFVLNLLRAMWPKLEAIKWTDFLYYYQTSLIVRDEAYRWGDLAVLLGASLVWWVAGLLVFQRRDVPAR